MDINKDVLRWVILLGAAPIWIPFLFTLWRDFNHALRMDGGLLGSPPTGRELEAVKRELAERPEVLVSEPIVRERHRRRPRMNAPAQRAAPAKPAEPRFRG
jgi:hypothetical protein